MTDTQHPHALIIRSDGSFEVIDWPTAGTLQTLYTGMGCTNVDALTLSPRLTMWVDGEGLINGKPVNRAATILYAIHREPHQHYHGDVIITGGADHQGDTLGLKDDEIVSLIEFHLTFTNAEIPSQRTK
ncbi:DUF3846 domain-containing protein [Streptomyces microflavus]|uniref:DUF3846 domain-containing protein n=1 Tax=Streptomyces microflavus TaxID=1919 RepID=UPI0033B13D26